MKTQLVVENYRLTSLNEPAMIAFVDAMAGMMFFTTPCVSDQVTPSILNSFARAAATEYSQPMCSGSSVSSFLSA